MFNSRLISFFALLTLVSVNIFAYETTVIIRHEKKARALKVKRELRDLVSTTSFDGEHFKIVQGTSSEAIPFNHENEDLLLKAATTYFHLTIARNYWVHVIGSEKIKNQPKMTIRLEMSRIFDEIGHFQNEANGSVYNNALSIPGGFAPDYINEINASMGLPLIRPWTDEIWFRPMKKIDTKTLDDSHLGDSPITANLKELRHPVFAYSRKRIKNDSIKFFFYDRYQAPFLESLAWNVGSIAMMHILIEASTYLDPLFMEKWYYLDTAAIPEVIYHEYAHIALSDHLEMKHSTAPVEGLADYFAAQVANRTKLYEKIDGRSTSLPKNLKTKKNYYNPVLEHPSHAHGDLVVQVLWDIKEEMPEIADKLIYNSRTHFTTRDSTIYRDFLTALLRSCDDVCKNPLRERNKLFSIFSQRAF